MAEAALTDAQWEARSKGIGSSDAAAACGLSPWKSRAELWAEKTGRIIPEDISDRDIIHFGNVLEDVVAQEFVRRTGRQVQRWTKPYVKGYMVANVDRLIVGEDAVLECKTADRFTAHKWDGDVPIHYRMQVAHQLVAADKAHGELAVLIGGNQFAHYPIEADKELRDLIIAREGEFWSYVERNTPPPVSTAAEVLTIYQASKEKTIEAPAELIELHRELMTLRAEKKSTDARLDEIKDALCSHMIDAEILLGPDGKPMVTWKQAKGSTKVNYEQAYNILASLVDEESAGAALSAATYQTKGSRRFLPKEVKQ